MAKIGLIDVDGHNFPNLCLMKLSAYYKTKGDEVRMLQYPCNEIKGQESMDDEEYNKIELDVAYMSKVFDETYSPNIPPPAKAKKIIKGGTGYGLSNKLHDEIEHIYPDYGLYPEFSEAYGFLTRGCPRNCPFCIVSQKEGRISRQVADLSEFWRGQKTIKLLDPNLLACRDHAKLLQQLIESGVWVDFTQGIDVRLLTADNIRLLQKVKTRMIHFAWDNEKDSNVIIKNLQLFKQITGINRRKAAVYVLTNYNTDFEFDLHRVYTLRELGYDPYVMIYAKPNAPNNIRMLQRWVNNKTIWTRVDRFEDYDRRLG